MQKRELFDIGDLSTLTTSSKKIAGAINELKTSVDGKFDKAGGTLTGNLTTSANITANSLISGANGLIAAKKMKTLDSNFMWLMNSTEGKWMTFDLIDEPKIYTYDSGKGTIGASDHRWGGVYSTNGDFSGSINLGGKGSIGADPNYAQLLIKAEPSNGVALEQNNKGMVFINGIFRPYTANNGAIDLGTPTQKFKDLYLSGDANITSLNATENVTGASLKATTNLNIGSNFIMGFAPDTKHMFIQNTQPNAVIEHTIQDGSGNTIGLTLQNEADNTLTLRPKTSTINCNIGQENHQWNNGYFKGGLNVGSLRATTIDADNIYSIEEVDALVSSNDTKNRVKYLEDNLIYGTTVTTLEEDINVEKVVIRLRAIDKTIDLDTMFANLVLTSKDGSAIPVSDIDYAYSINESSDGEEGHQLFDDDMLSVINSNDEVNLCGVDSGEAVGFHIYIQFNKVVNISSISFKYWNYDEDVPANEIHVGLYQTKYDFWDPDYNDGEHEVKAKLESELASNTVLKDFGTIMIDGNPKEFTFNLVEDRSPKALWDEVKKSRGSYDFLEERLDAIDSLVSGNSITVENVLTSTSTTNALSAAQGKALNDGKLDKTGGTLTGNITFGTNNSISVKKIKSLSDGIMWIMNSAEGNYVTFDLRSTPEMTIDSIAFKNKGTIKADPSYAQLLISAEANNGIAFEQGNSGLVFMNNTFRPYTANNGAVDLGASAQKFKDLYLSGNITADSVNGKRQWTGTKAQYDAIATKDANTLYFVLKE